MTDKTQRTENNEINMMNFDVKSLNLASRFILMIPPSSTHSASW